MKNHIKIIADTIRLVMDSIVSKIPKKLSELEIDTELGVKSWNDLEDKPFGTKIKENVYIEEQTVEFISYGSTAIAYISRLKYIECDAICNVYFDGVLYENIVVYESDADMCYYADFTTENGDRLSIYESHSIHAPASYVGQTHTIKVCVLEKIINSIDEKYIPDSIARSDYKLDKTDPCGNGSFSMNRKYNTEIGSDSTTLGVNVEASANYSFAQGNNVCASSKSQHVFGEYNIISNPKRFEKVEEKLSTAINYRTTTTLYGAAEYIFNEDTGEYELVNPISFTADKIRQNLNYNNDNVYYISERPLSNLMYAVHNSGSNHGYIYGSKIYIYNPTVYRRINTRHTRTKYAHIVGNGTSDTARSNAHTLDWEGNAEYQGDVIAKGCGGETPISLVGLHENVDITDEEVINMLATGGVITTITDINGDTFTDVNGDVIVF